MFRKWYWKNKTKNKQKTTNLTKNPQTISSAGTGKITEKLCVCVESSIHMGMHLIMRRGGKGLRTSYLYMIREHFIAMRAQHMSEVDYVSPCR